jgi:hypothetical protein
MAVSRDQALATLGEGQERLDALFNRLDHDQLAQPATIGGGSWAAKDLMGHIAFWEELALRTLDRCRAGLTPLPGDETTDQLNERNQSEQAALAPAQLRDRAASAHAALISALGTISDTEWHTPTDKDDTLGDVLGGVLGAEGKPFGHAWAHLDDLQAYVAALS